MLKMPISSHWRSISVVLPLLFISGAALATAPALARAPETAAVLETIDSGSVARSAVEALLTRANAGDAEAAEVAARLYDRGIGVKWDPPSALRWYAAAAIAGSDSAKREASRLWRVMPPVSQRRAEAVLARFFTDAELAGINLGPVRRPTTQRSWMANLEAGGFLAAPPPAVTPAPALIPALVPAPVKTPTPASVAAPVAVKVPAVASVPAPAAVAKPLSPQLMSAVAAPPVVQPTLHAPATASPAAPVAAAPGSIVPPPPHKPRRKDAAGTPMVVPAALTPVPSVKPKR
jgi:hypothetical protein